MKENKGKIILIAAILIVAACIAYVCYGFMKDKNPIATIEVSYVDENGNEKNGIIKIELDKNAAPDSVANFVNLANNGFYDGLTFHRVVEDFMIQGGDPEGNGTGSAHLSKLDKSVVEGSNDDYLYSIKGEFAKNGVKNPLKFEKGVIGMGRSDFSDYEMYREGYNSASSQFFIVTTDNEETLNNLNESYASFGKVIEGLDVAEAISKLEVEGDKPVNVPVIKSIKVDTFGVKYKIPETINYGVIQSQVLYYNQLNQMYQQQVQDQINEGINAEIEKETAENAEENKIEENVNE